MFSKAKMLAWRPEDWLLLQRTRRRKNELTVVRDNQSRKRKRFL